MAANLIPLEQAAAMLRVTPDTLDDMRKRGDIHALRDGTSWKFKRMELQRVADDMGMTLADASEAGAPETGDVGSSGTSGLALDLDLDEGGGTPTAVGSPEQAVATPPPVPGGDSEISLSADDGGSDPSLGAGVSDVLLGDGTDGVAQGGGSGSIAFEGSDVGLRSDLTLSQDDQLALGDGDDNLTLGGGDSEVRLDEEDEESVLEGGSDVTRGAGDTGINLKPSDSGLNLEEVPLDLAGSSVSSLELPEDDDIIALDDLEVSPDDATQLRADEDFQLAPSATTPESEEEDSGSQVIALEDSDSFKAQGTGSVLGSLDGVEPLLGEEPAEPLVDDTALAETPAPVTLPRDFVAPAPEMAYSIWNILSLLAILLLLSVTGMLMTDLMRNMWSWDGTFSASTPIMDGIIQLLGGMGP
jgi:hypothetical protein